MPASQALRSEQVHAATQLLALPAWLGQHWQAEVNYAFPSGHSIAAMSLAQFFGLIWLARALPGPGCCRSGPSGSACRAP
jgi:phosphatidylglycerophosphatase B